AFLLYIHMDLGNKRIGECIAARGSFTSDKQKYSSYPFAFDRNCPYGVSDKEIIDKNNIKVCQPHLPPFQNQYTIHSHFQDLFLKPDCPSCIEGPPSVCDKTSDLNNNPECIKNDCLVVDPNATQFATIPLGRSLYCEKNKESNMEKVISSSILSPSRLDPIETFLGDISMALSWVIAIFIVLTIIAYLARSVGLRQN
ncbi:MAG: hypothetical protein WD512_06060, partial [Candidatus Paceibacterota bacterium]